MWMHALAAVLLTSGGVCRAQAVTTADVAELENAFSQMPGRVPALSEQLLERAHSQPEMLLTLGRVEGLHKNFVLAERAFTRLCELQPESFAAQFNLGLTLYQAGEAERASAPLRIASSLQPDAFDAQYLYGVTLSQTGRKMEAIRILRHAHLLSPAHGGAQQLLGVLYLDQGFSLDAAEVLTMAVRQDPQNLKLLLLLADAHHRNFQSDKALQAMETAVLNFHQSPEVHFRRGYELESVGRFDEAVASYRAALRLQPGNPEAALALGRLVLRGGDSAEAIKLFETASLGKNTAQDARLELAKAYLMADKSDAARALLEKISSERPDDALPHLLLSTIYNKTNQPERSRAERERYLRLRRPPDRNDGGASSPVPSSPRRFIP